MFHLVASWEQIPVCCVALATWYQHGLNLCTGRRFDFDGKSTYLLDLTIRHDFPGQSDV